MAKKEIYVNLKRFDIPKELGGVNSISKVENWAKTIISNVDELLEEYGKEARFTFLFPELHIISAVAAKSEKSVVEIGCQGVHREDVEEGKNFGAFSTQRTAKAMQAAGVSTTMIGHCEERNDKKNLLRLAGVEDFAVIHQVLREEVLTAQKAGLHVLFCVGETMEEQGRWQEVLRMQLTEGLQGADLEKVTIAYEPVWAIGPGKTPPGQEYIRMISEYIKEVMGDIPVVYGGGLKKDNAKMLSSIESIDGGLIALTRFQGDIGFYPEEYLEIVGEYLA